MDIKQNTPQATALLAIYAKPKAVQSDFAREFATEVGALASAGLVTTRVPGKDTEYGRLWRVTHVGMSALRGLRLV